MAFVAVANYTQPNFELGYALKFMRLLLLILTACFNVVGFVAGCIIIVCLLAFNKTLSGRNYLNIKLQYSFGSKKNKGQIYPSQRLSHEYIKYVFPQTTGQADMFTCPFGDCREGLIPRYLHGGL